jgi:hypothetical protein
VFLFGGSDESGPSNVVYILDLGVIGACYLSERKNSKYLHLEYLTMLELCALTTLSLSQQALERRDRSWYP